MIPERIALKGFLSYAAEQTLSFDGHSLLLLWGPNGSGKSSVFDGITFALFGGHRGGKDDYHELINKDCDSASVEFDFRLDHHRYRVRRSLQRNKKGKATVKQEVREWHGGTNGTVGAWEPVADTTKRVDFDKWIVEHVGLNFETFTTSVLLVQGKADKLLTADPRERHQLLAGIIGMDRYEKLHAEAVLWRNKLDTQCTSLQDKLTEMPVVTESELAAAAQAIAAADAKGALARAEVERLDQLEGQARRWTDLQGALVQVRNKAKQAQSLLDRSTEIERDWQELTDLRQALPGCRRVVDQRERQSSAERQLSQLNEKQQALVEQSLAVQQALEQTEQKRDQLEKGIAAAELRRQDIATERQTLALALPQLKRLLHDRHSLKQSSAAQAEAVAAGQRAAADVELCRTGLAPLVERLAEASKAREQADHEVTRQKTLLEEIRARLERFTQVVGDKMCRYCGQALTPGHVAEEQAKLKQQLAEARGTHEQAVQTRTAFCQQEKQAAQQHRAAADKLAAADRCVNEWRARWQEAAHDCQRSTESCVAAYSELAEPYRSRVSSSPPTDWLQVAFPAQEDVVALQARQTALTDEQATKENTLRTGKQKLAANQEETTRLGTERDRVREARDGVEKEQVKLEAIRRAAREAVTAALAELPTPWQERAATVNINLLQAAETLVDDDRLNGPMLVARVLADRQSEADGDPEALAAAEHIHPLRLRALATHVIRLEHQCLFGTALLAALLQAKPAAGEVVEDIPRVGHDRLLGLAHDVALQPVAIQIFRQQLVKAVLPT